MKNKNVKNVSKLLVALLIISALLPVVYATDDTEDFGVSLPIDYTATPPDTSANDTESFGMSLVIDYTAAGEPPTEYNDTESFGISLPVDYTAENHAPSIIQNSPGNGSTGVDVNASLNVTVSDPDGDNMTITFWNWTGSVWESFGQLTNKGNGTYVYNPTGDFAYNTTYTWRASANDSLITNNTETWTFTTAAEGETPNQPPTANFTYSAVGLTVSFTDTSNDPDGNVTSWSWNFGDGSFSTAQNPSHIYASSGAYNVTLTVKDNNNATDSTYELISISSGSGSIIDSDLYQYFWYFIIILVALFVLVFVGLIYRRK